MSKKICVFLSFSGIFHLLRRGLVTLADLDDGIFFPGCRKEHLLEGAKLWHPRRRDGYNYGPASRVKAVVRRMKKAEKEGRLWWWREETEKFRSEEDFTPARRGVQLVMLCGGIVAPPYKTVHSASYGTPTDVHFQPFSAWCWVHNLPVRIFTSEEVVACSVDVADLQDYYSLPAANYKTDVVNRWIWEMGAVPRGNQEVRLTPRMVCKDGFAVSVQASLSHYCSPRGTHPDEPWTQVECGFPSEHVPAWDEFQETPRSEDVEEGKDPTEDVYPYVPIEKVLEAFETHGGFDPIASARERAAADVSQDRSAAWNRRIRRTCGYYRPYGGLLGPKCGKSGGKCSRDECPGRRFIPVLSKRTKITSVANTDDFEVVLAAGKVRRVDGSDLRVVVVNGDAVLFAQRGLGQDALKLYDFELEGVSEARVQEINDLLKMANLSAVDSRYLMPGHACLLAGGE